MRRSRLSRWWYGSYGSLARGEREFAWLFLSVIVIMTTIALLLFQLTPNPS